MKLLSLVFCVLSVIAYSDFVCAASEATPAPARPLVKKKTLKKSKKKIAPQPRLPLPPEEITQETRSIIAGMRQYRTARSRQEYKELQRQRAAERRARQQQAAAAQPGPVSKKIAKKMAPVAVTKKKFLKKKIVKKKQRAQQLPLEMDVAHSTVVSSASAATHAQEKKKNDAQKDLEAAVRPIIQEHAKRMQEALVNAYKARKNSVPLEKFLSQYDPTVQRCGPGVQVDKRGDPVLIGNNSLTTTYMGTIACVLAGYKNIGHLMPSLYRSTLFTDIPGEIRELLNEQGIKWFSTRNVGAVRSLYIYRPEGFIDALLYVKWLSTLGAQSFYYSEGYFFGYSDRNIKAFYERSKEIGGGEADFEGDRARTYEWLVRNRPGIEQWFQEHEQELQKEQGIYLHH
ncbi:MAG TPA: hypothetical protein VLG71_00795 [Candidatus Limnocylindria bacterium]|nr:hypothetical protein [Candidatus Limnocylindria bacterium]